MELILVSLTYAMYLCCINEIQLNLTTVCIKQKLFSLEYENSIPFIKIK